MADNLQDLEQFKLKKTAAVPTSTGSNLADLSAFKIKSATPTKANVPADFMTRVSNLVESFQTRPDTSLTKPLDPTNLAMRGASMATGGMINPLTARVTGMAEKVATAAPEFTEKYIVPPVEKAGKAAAETLREMPRVPDQLIKATQPAIPAMGMVKTAQEAMPTVAEVGAPFTPRLAAGVVESFAPTQAGMWYVGGKGASLVAKQIPKVAQAAFKAASPEVQGTILKLGKYLEKEFSVGGGRPLEYEAAKKGVLGRKIEAAMDTMKLGEDLQKYKMTPGALSVAKAQLKGESKPFSEAILNRSPEARAFDNIVRQARGVQDKWSQLLADSGLPPEAMKKAIEENLGKYLTRVYEKGASKLDPTELMGLMKEARVRSSLFKRRLPTAILMNKLMLNKGLTPGMEKFLAKPEQEALVRELFLKEVKNPFAVIGMKVNQIADAVGKAELFETVMKNPEWAAASKITTLTKAAEEKLAPIYAKQSALRTQALEAGETISRENLTGARLNIGMAVDDGTRLTEAEIKAMLQKFNHNISQYKIHKSATEDTFVVDIDRPFEKEQLHELSKQLRQNAIPQFDHTTGKGMMAGPQAAKWGEFNPDYFLNMEGKPIRVKAALEKEVADLEERIAKFKGKVSETKDVPVPEGFVAMPMDRKAWGALAGQYVKEDVYNDLMTSKRFLTNSNNLYNKVLSAFKYSKVALNPAAQARNFMTNMILLDLSGVPFHTLPKEIAGAALAIGQKDPTFIAALKEGVFGSSFTDIELGFNRFARNIASSGFDTADDALTGSNTVIQTMRELALKPGEFYRYNENISKFTRFRWGIRNGESPAEAAAQAQKWVFDYSKVPHAIEFMRRMPFGAPFITFSYKALPRVAESLMTNPMKLYKYKAFVDGWNKAAQQQLDITQGDAENIPDYLKTNLPGVPSYMLMPFKTPDGRKLYLDTTYLQPLGMAPDIMERGLIKGIMGNPVYTIPSDLAHNKDTFGRDIVPPGIDELNPAEANRLRLTYVVTQLMPSLTPPIYGVTEKGGASAEKIVDAIMQKKYYGKEKQSVNRMLLDVFAGLKLTPVDEVVVQKQKVSKIQDVANGFKQEMRKIGQAELDGRLTRKEAEAERKFYQQQIQRYTRAQQRLMK